MAKDETRRLKPSQLQADRDLVAALAQIAGYAPADAAYSVASMQARQTAMAAKQGTEAQAKAAADTARDQATASEWDFHNHALRIKEMVVGQFGSDSNEAQAVGLKKKSERRAPTRKKAG